MECSDPTVQVTTTEVRCAEGCRDAWLGDGMCDTGCNVEECNFDDGDCVDSVTQCEWECGIPNALNERRELIVGGEPSEPHEYPFMVLLQINGNFACGGSIIDKNWVNEGGYSINGFQTQNFFSTPSPHDQFQIFGRDIWEEVT